MNDIHILALYSTWLYAERYYPYVVFTPTFVGVCLFMANSNLQPQLSANLWAPVLAHAYKCRRMRASRRGALPLVAELSQKVNKAFSQT